MAHEASRSGLLLCGERVEMSSFFRFLCGMLILVGRVFPCGGAPRVWLAGLGVLFLVACSPAASVEHEPEPGARGPRGERGKPGVCLTTGSHAVIRQATVGGFLNETVWAKCADGEEVLSGGCQFGGQITGNHLLLSELDGELYPSGWECSGDNYEPDPVYIAVYLLCSGEGDTIVEEVEQ